MALIQGSFLGASITGFNATMGWGTQASTCTVNLVEDPDRGDSFAPPVVGTAVNFDYDQWHFGGILQGYQQQYGQQGNPVYSLQIQDPRELLAGVQLILNDYTGTTGGMPNLYNIYGYLEALYGFGGSQVNEAGMPWWLIRDSFYRLQLTTPIYFRGAYYLFDPFYNLSLLPNYFRISGDSISALEYVQNVCDAMACDFAIEMVPLDNDETPAVNLIRVRIIRRNIIPANNAINTFVESVEGAVTKQAGYELSNEVTSRFVVGGKMNNMYFQDSNTFNTPSEYDDTILPYWGYDPYDRLIVGTGDFNGDTGSEYQFMLDGRPISVQTNKQGLIHYYTDLAEMQAARAGQESWESFLAFHNSHPTSIHHGKSDLIGITDGKLNDEMMRHLKEAKSDGVDKLPKRPAIHSLDTSPKALRAQDVWNEETKAIIGKVYNYIRKFATEYYGRKFMVRVPFVAGAWVPESNKIRLSMIPVSTGYVPEENWGNAIYLGYMPYNPEKFTDSNNKLYPYVAFSGMTGVDPQEPRSQYAFDKLSPQSYILDQYPNLKLGKMRENLYVKGQVDDKLVFINPTTMFSPRAVITLDAPVPSNIKNIEQESVALYAEIKKYLLEEPTVLAEGDVDTWLNEFGALAGADWSWKPKEANFQMPTMCAVPLESQVLRYGPWYLSNSPGRVEFENDSSLVPWNFGSFVAMNNAGWAKVTSALTTQQSHEQGQVEFPGVPTLSLGSALIDSGPFVTDVNVDVSDAGVTTTYRMNTWNWQFGRMGKYNVERFARISKVAQEQRKAFRRFYGYKQPLTLHGMENEGKRSGKEPSVLTFSGEIRAKGEGSKKRALPSVAGQTGKTMTRSLNDDNYAGKAGVGMDGLFVPYTTKVDASGDMPKFEEPSAGAGTPNVNDLNPFGGSGVSMVYPETDGTLPDSLTQDNTLDVKSIALRAPVIIAGWGHDTNGNPVPSGDSGEFLPNYKERADMWKAGPLDVRWDDNKKTWNAAGGGSDMRIAYLAESLTHRASGVAYDFNPVLATGVSTGIDYDTEYQVWDCLLPNGQSIGWGATIVISEINSKWYVIAASPRC